MSLSLNLESIILLLFFIAPGFVFTRTYTAYRPRYYREPTAFEQFVLAIVGSTVIHSAGVMMLTLVAGLYWFITGKLVPMLPLLPLNNFPLPVLVGLSLVGFVYLAGTLIVARRSATELGRRTPADRPTWWRVLLGPDPPEPFLLWHTMLQIEPLQKDLIPPRLNIQMRTGEFFKGDLYQMRLVGDEANTVELALRNVYYRASAPTVPGRPVLSAEGLEAMENQVVLLKSDDILWVTRSDL